jgi:RNA polymerase sigma factor (sigma-70 family)
MHESSNHPFVREEAANENTTAHCGENCACRLLEKCLLTGRSDLWSMFLERTRRIMSAVISRVLRRSFVRFNPATIEDLTQDVYLKLCSDDFRILREFKCEHENSLYGFLKVVALNVAQDYVRACATQRRGAGLMHLSLEDVPTAQAEVTRVSSRQWERKLKLIDIGRALDNYSYRGRGRRDSAIFVLYYRQGLSAKDIVRTGIAGLSVKGVESAIHRVSRHLRQTLLGKRKAAQISR